MNRSIAKGWAIGLILGILVVPFLARAAEEQAAAQQVLRFESLPIVGGAPFPELKTLSGHAFSVCEFLFQKQRAGQVGHLAGVADQPGRVVATPTNNTRRPLSRSFCVIVLRSQRTKKASSGLLPRRAPLRHSFAPITQ